MQRKYIHATTSKHGHPTFEPMPTQNETSLFLPSPVQPISEEMWPTGKKVHVYVKRDDLIHAVISGNKWRKLKYNLEEMDRQEKRGLITVGGAFSNHILATAFAGYAHGCSTIGIIRGEDADLENPTLKRAIRYGMEIRPMNRPLYDQLKRETFYWQAHFPHYHFVPEGGCNSLGVKGTMEIMDEVRDEFDLVAVSAGTGTTASGLLVHSALKRLLVLPPFKGPGPLKRDILEMAEKTGNSFDPEKLEVVEGYDFGGFAKVNAELVNFANRFAQSTGIFLDPIYTAKLFYGVYDLIEKDQFRPGSRILLLHTGGLQGLKGMNQRLTNQPYHFDEPR
ncbi:MAG: pyridoxal-phosphate dependent enzyme [Bacteroidota bacterium]|nr:pyridoxal-phosphate dependent enzyme [Bacteroidota bacterium]